MEKLNSSVKKRFVLLQRLLTVWPHQTITSVQIEKFTGASSCVVRKDIQLLDLPKGVSNGYKTSELKSAVEKKLGLESAKKCCIVGLGKLGQTLLESNQLQSTPFTICAGFDSNVNRTEVLRSIYPLHPTTKLEQVIKAEQIDFAVLCVEPHEAQIMAKKLQEAGIKGIVNYTGIVLEQTDSCRVENISLVESLMYINY